MLKVMKGPLGTVTLVMLITGAVPAAAYSQGFISPLIGYDFGGDSGCPELTGCEDKNLNIGLAVGSLGRAFGTELELAYATNFFGEIPDTSSHVLTLMGHVMLAPRFGPAQPYGLVGLGLIRTNVESQAATARHNHFGWDVGGGLMVFVSRHVGLRGDVRYFHAFQDVGLLGIPLGETQLDFGRAAASVVLKF